MLSIGIIRNNMTLKSFSKKVDISIYIHEVPHKPDICCIDFFSVVYFKMSNKILIFPFFFGRFECHSRLCICHNPQIWSSSAVTNSFVTTCGQMKMRHVCNFYANLTRVTLSCSHVKFLCFVFLFCLCSQKKYWIYLMKRSPVRLKHDCGLR